MPRVFLDANVIFSAALTEGGVARAIFAAARKPDNVSLISTEYALEEARTNLERKAPQALREFKDLLATVTVPEEPPRALVQELGHLVPDPQDAQILAGAVSTDSHVLVTGNTKHFRELYGRQIRDVLVLTPRDTLTLLLPAG